jgi:hypothetical protein
MAEQKVKGKKREMMSDQLLDGARNLVQWAEIAAGQDVLIHVEPGYDDPEVLSALRNAASEAGAKVSVLHTPHWNRQSEAPPAVLERALDGADVLISQGEYLYASHSRYMQVQLFEKGLRYFNNVAKTKEALSSSYGRFPTELTYAIGKAVIDRLTKAKTIRVTTPAGTDLTMSLRPETVGGYCYPVRHDTPGFKKDFPGGVACFHPEDPVEGVLVAEAIHPVIGAPKVILDDPLRMVYKDHRAVEMSGDCAEWIQDYWERSGDENSTWLAECMWGIHPKAGGVGSPNISNPHLLHFGLGNSLSYGGPVYSKSWAVIFVQDATLVADDETILDRGHLTVLELPEVRAAAARLSDSDELLTQVDSTLADLFGGGKNG